MSDRQEVRVSDQDPEMLAMKAMASACERLDRDQCRRVLTWASQRYVDDLTILNEVNKALREAWIEINGLAKEHRSNAFDLTDAVRLVLTEGKRIRDEKAGSLDA